MQTMMLHPMPRQRRLCHSRVSTLVVVALRTKSPIDAVLTRALYLTSMPAKNREPTLYNKRSALEGRKWWWSRNIQVAKEDYYHRVRHAPPRDAAFEGCKRKEQHV